MQRTLDMTKPTLEQFLTCFMHGDADFKHHSGNMQLRIVKKNKEDIYWGDIKGFFTSEAFEASKDILVDESYLIDPRCGLGIFIFV